MPSGSSLIYKINGTNGFGYSGATRKIGVWDSNFKFQYNLKISEIANFTPNFNCYIRIVFQVLIQNVSIKNTKTKKVN